ncbi:MAG: hypothetical protein JNL12_05680 [Planctomycetes bacterium]|nr:hypothetical protein [Planctomycetota bacterium]
MDFKLKAGMPGMPSIPPQLPGVLFVLGAAVAGFGMLVLIYEWLVRWLVAGVFMVLGLVLLMTAARARRMLG